MGMKTAVAKLGGNEFRKKMCIEVTEIHSCTLDRQKNLISKIYFMVG